MAKVSTRKRGSKWYYSIEATDYMPDGKRRRIEKGGYLSKKEAEAAGAAAMTSLAKGNINLLSEKVLVKDFVEEWLKIKEGELKPTTIRGYRIHIAPIVNALGDKQIQKLRPKDINAVMMQLSSQGYARRTLQDMLGVFSRALSYAVFPSELLQSNPAKYIKTPKNAPAKVIERVVIRQDKLNELLTAYPLGHQCHIPILLAYHTGMRLGEVLGLTWEDVDLSKGTISVVRQLAYTPSTGYYFDEPKTATSKRTIPIDNTLIALLRRHKAAQSAAELEQGAAYMYAYEGDNGSLWQISKGDTTCTYPRRRLVCTNDKGKTVPRGSITAAMAAHGVNFHSLRHTHATLCAENGASVKGLAGRLGHSKISITADLYTHETDLMQEQTKNAFLSALVAKK